MRGVIEGLLQPLTTPAHVLALLAFGLLAGQQPTRQFALVPTAAFAAGVTAGLAAIVLAVEPRAAADALLAATVIAATLVVLAKPLPIWSAAILLLAGGIALGLDSPPQGISIAVAIAVLVGTGLGSSLALAAVAACVARLHRFWQRVGTRIVGAWIAASAILVLALRFARGQLF